MWTFPSCQVHYNLLSEYNSFYDFAFKIPFAPHGPIHLIMGGIMGECSSRYETLREIDTVFDSDDYIKYMKNIAFVSSKNLFRSKMLECPGVCEDGEVCTCSCPHLQDAYDNDSLDDYLDQIVVHWDTFTTVMASYPYALSNDAKYQFIETVCEVNAIAGDQLESGSPMDISFWPIHPTTERLYQF